MISPRAFGGTSGSLTNSRTYRFAVKWPGPVALPGLGATAGCRHPRTSFSILRVLSKRCRTRLVPLVPEVIDVT